MAQMTLTAGGHVPNAYRPNTTASQKTFTTYQNPKLSDTASTTVPIVHITHSMTISLKRNRKLVRRSMSLQTELSFSWLCVAMFYIGSNVMNWPLEAQRGVTDGHEICVREYSYPPPSCSI